MDRPFPPTQRRIERALAEGDVPLSRLAIRTAALAGALVLAPSTFSALSARFRVLLSDALRAPELSTPDVLAPELWKLAVPALATMATLAFAVGILQTGGRLRNPRSNRSSRRGIGVSAIAAARSMICAAAVSVALWGCLRGSGRDLRDVLEPATALAASWTFFGRLAWGFGGVLLGLAACDLAVSRAIWLSGLRMSRREVLEERRLAEAPLLARRARRRAWQALVREDEPERDAAAL